MTARFEQVNVFSTHPLKGNPLAVVYCDAHDYSDATMQAFARWTQLSETVFISPPSDARADYHVRIFTPTKELPFAGHPTLGACHSWLNGRRQAVTYQQSAIGIVEIRQVDDQLFFEAPPIIEQRTFTDDEFRRCLAATGLRSAEIIATSLLCNGPAWHCIVVDSVERLMEINIDYSAMPDLKLGVCSIKEHSQGLVVRAFIGGDAVEDPVTGSLQAVLAQWLIGAGKLPHQYRAQQGAYVGAEGDVEIRQFEGRIFVGGRSSTIITGDVTLL
ncbi:PhzF family phenazine biosynthesis protein [Rosenbergiella collisarenosi]|uniref:PhzF family phenazine biosynthesis protein n=1 Tax=Rosenbergiella collisarenosi TaxID=1544695 RepID=UPI001BDA1DD7|nr:PhzF family phenazine biosynthesis protein [Rosenbergiella collisarenosi]MBT0721934.1 PhzF family phenazine biosynthesis protein [Rosenbergiella collisarenosi]